MRIFEDFLNSLTYEERLIFESNDYLFSIPVYFKMGRRIKNTIDIELPILEVIDKLNSAKVEYKKYGLENVEIELESDYENLICNIIVKKSETDSEYEERIFGEEKRIKDKIKNIIKNTDNKYTDSLSEIKRLKEENEVLRRIAYKSEKEEFGRRVSGDAI